MPDCHTGVFAFEGDWHEDLTKKDSIRPTLETLRDVQKVSFVHRRIGTAEELKYYLGVFAVSACTCSQFREGSAFGAAFSGFRRLCGL